MTGFARGIEKRADRQRDGAQKRAFWQKGGGAPLPPPVRIMLFGYHETLIGVLWIHGFDLIRVLIR